MEMAKEMQITCITMLGSDGGEAVSYGDINIVVPSAKTVRIQEMQLHIIHTLCMLIEQRLYAPQEVNRQKTNGTLRLNGISTFQ
jgi:hypothetical protein